LAVVLEAIRRAGLDPLGFRDWAVVASPRFLGRSAFERAFPDFQAEGAWGVSPHLVPHNSLHSLSGTLSQVLGAHGANLGVGGSPGGEREAFLAAASFLADRSSAGVWVVLTGWSDVSLRDSASPGWCEALAIGLTTPSPERTAPRLMLAPGLVLSETHIGASSERPLDLGRLAGWLESLEPAGRACAPSPGTQWRLDERHGSDRIGVPHSAPATSEFRTTPSEASGR
jgi:hypothetical protein